MSPLSVAKVDLELGVGLDLEGGGAGHERPTLPLVPSRSSEPLDARERRELCDLFEELGPDAPTLCEGWTTADLAAHLVVRERNPTAAPGHPPRRLLRGAHRAVHGARPRHPATARWSTASATVHRSARSRCPGLRTLLNLQEYVVHHEDVRRANGLGPRTDRPDLDDALWGNLRRGARLLLRKVHGATVRLQRPGGDAITTGHGPEVVVTGEPVDLLLYLFGREAAAQVEITGDPDAQAHPGRRAPKAMLRRAPRRGRHAEPADEAAAAEAGEALPQHREEHVGGALETGVAVVDPVLGARPPAGRPRLRRPAGPSGSRPTRRRCARSARGGRPGSPGAGATQPPPSRSRPPRLSRANTR